MRIHLRDQVYRHLQTLGPAYLATERSGALVENSPKASMIGRLLRRFLPTMTLTMILPLALLTSCCRWIGWRAQCC
ncbi:hypothetical protein [Chromatium okenii]|uniref:hypothetical protein n=1 Tax=Chromatium okenii TaxID=61644 RepID=UPI001F5B4D6E|nr:hypothetical protein [Chromatium okenii]